MTLFQALNVIAECEKAEREERPGCHCAHGHIDCSFKANGPCFDEACTVVEAHEKHTLPVDLCQETAYGSTVRLPFQIRCF